MEKEGRKEGKRRDGHSYLVNVVLSSSQLKSEALKKRISVLLNYLESISGRERNSIMYILWIRLLQCPFLYKAFPSPLFSQFNLTICFTRFESYARCLFYICMLFLFTYGYVYHVASITTKASRSGCVVRLLALPSGGSWFDHRS